MKVTSVNPCTEDVNGAFALLDKDEALRICGHVKEESHLWRELTVNQRAERFRKLASVMRENKDEYAKLMTQEMGKPMTQALGEIEKCAWTSDFFADNAERWLVDEQVEMEGRKSAVTFTPIGVVLCVMPWNFPFWQLMRCAIPAMLAGNVCILRHSNVVPMCAMAIESAFKLAGFPENSFRTLLTDHKTVEAMVASDFVDGVSVTGSVEAGKTIASAAAAALKKVVLELGGSDPFIVLESADIEEACKGAAEGRLINSGQSCICAKRFIVVEKRAAAFIAGLTKRMKQAKVGDPIDVITEVGPLASAQQLKTAVRQVRSSVSKGAKVKCGGGRLGKRGFFFNPTVMVNVDADMPIWKEEVFAPIAPVMVVKDREEAIKVANESEFGLGASVWTKNQLDGEVVARRLDAGMVYINEVEKSDPRLPFGGTKKSGLGRELSRYGLLEFVNIKPVVAKL